MKTVNGVKNKMKTVNVRALPVIDPKWRVAILDDDDFSKVIGKVVLDSSSFIGYGLIEALNQVNILRDEVKKFLNTDEEITLQLQPDQESKYFPRNGTCSMQVYDLLPDFSDIFTENTLKFFEDTSNFSPKAVLTVNKEVKEDSESAQIFIFDEDIKEVEEKDYLFKRESLDCSYFGFKSSESTFEKDVKEFGEYISTLVDSKMAFRYLSKPIVFPVLNLEGTGEPRFMLLCYLFLKDSEVEIAQKYKVDSQGNPIK